MLQTIMLDEEENQNKMYFNQKKLKNLKKKIKKMKYIWNSSKIKIYLVHSNDILNSYQIQLNF